jgi:hypothetical protein
MENENTMSAASAAIRWTDAEWNEIVVRLLQGRGPVPPGSDALAGIGAREVFEAQQALPAPRQRKQVSIAQGFQGIRARLREEMRQRQEVPPAAPAAGLAQGDLARLAETARPFVAMLCEELANALVRTSLQPEGAALRPFLASLAAPGIFRDADDAPPAMHAEEDSAAEAGALPEIQPLFDPKLPPSASSDFKPVIGLVASRAGEYAELQELYPQLRLSIVAADAVRSPEVFRHCQRIIGLRNELPAATDDLLRQSLSSRYVRLHGGAPQVREQLNAWLENPVSISAAPRREPRPGNGKRRGKWPPRISR